MKFRLLKANEIDCRIATINSKGLTLLLYKDARVDQNILDEEVGAMNWQRHHSRDNANCIVSIWDEHKCQWVEKEDTGTESYTEAEKGLASDSFKRACFNWGIGRELYTAPFIWISANDATIKQGDNGKYQCYDKFIVEDIQYDKNRNISYLAIKNTKTNKRVFEMDKTALAAAGEKVEEYTDAPATARQMMDLTAELNRTGLDIAPTLIMYKCDNITQLTQLQANRVINTLKGKPDKAKK